MSLICVHVEFTHHVRRSLSRRVDIGISSLVPFSSRDLVVDRIHRNGRILTTDEDVLKPTKIHLPKTRLPVFLIRK